MRRLHLPDWLRRSLEGALIGGGVAIVSLLGLGLGQGGPAGPIVAIPPGAAGALLLAPAVLGVGVVACSYPVAMAGTRSDAILGGIAGFLLAADACLIAAAGPVALARSGVVLGAGLLVGLMALIAGMAGILAGQVASPVGFGRRAGAWSAVIATIAGLVTLIVLALVG